MVSDVSRPPPTQTSSAHLAIGTSEAKAAEERRVESQAAELDAAIQATEGRIRLKSAEIIGQEEELQCAQRMAAALEDLTGSCPGAVGALWETLLELRQTVKKVDDEQSCRVLAKLAQVWRAMADVETHVALLQALVETGSTCTADLHSEVDHCPNSMMPCKSRCSEAELCAHIANLENSLRESNWLKADLRMRLSDNASMDSPDKLKNAPSRRDLNSTGSSDGLSDDSTWDLSDHDVFPTTLVLPERVFRCMNAHVEQPPRCLDALFEAEHLTMQMHEDPLTMQKPTFFHPSFPGANDGMMGHAKDAHIQAGHQFGPTWSSSTSPLSNVHHLCCQAVDGQYFDLPENLPCGD
jgi:hypothetical protein